jgi:hypothetical protein
MNDDLESQLRDALRARAERTPIAGDGLDRIRTRTARRRLGRLQPAVAAGALTVLVVAGVAMAAEHNHTGHPDLVLPAGPGAPAVSASPQPTKTLHPDPIIITGPRGPSDPPLVTRPPQPTSTDIPTDTGGEYLAITKPASGATVDRDLTVSGKARVFEAQFTVDVTQNGVVVHTAHVTASIGAPSMGVWSTVFHLAPGSYKIEAYELSPKGDGTKAATDTIWVTVG